MAESATLHLDDSLTSSTRDSIFEEEINNSTVTSLSNNSLKEASPPQHDSEYKWCRTQVDKNIVWYRNMDGMANFILHWQHRFHNHGDMYARAILERKDEHGHILSLNIHQAHLREALRRLRSVHPYIAVELKRRKDLNAPPVKVSPRLGHLDLQYALSYTVPCCEADIEEWLDRVIVVHSKEESRDFGRFYQEMTSTHRGSVHNLCFHFWEPASELGLPTQIILEQSHVLSDGGGILTALDELVSMLAIVINDPRPSTIEWQGNEVINLPPSLQDAIAKPPQNWTVTQKELKQVQRRNRSRISGKATDPTIVDKLLDRVLEITLANYTSEQWIRRKLIRPLVSVVRSVAEKGDIFPIGLLPSATKPFHGPWSRSEVLEFGVAKVDADKLLCNLRKQHLTIAPFVEATMAFATTWVRRQRGLSAKRDDWDEKTRVIGSFSNPVNKRNLLVERHQRYLGLAMGGLVTKISAAKARWSDQSVFNAVPSSLDTADKVPARIDKEDFNAIVQVAREFGQQYAEGRSDENWLKYDKATMISNMQSEYMGLSNEAFYPSQPWLSSLGRIDSLVKPSRPIPSKTSILPFVSTAFDPSQPSWTLLEKYNQQDGTLEVKEIRAINRQHLAHPNCHFYSYRGEMTMTVAYPHWLYSDPSTNERQMYRHGIDYSKRANIVALWFSVVRQIIQAFVDDDDDDAT